MLRVRGRQDPASRVAGDAEWYKDAIIYELHVRSFQDSNADGVGDFPGLISRLSYLQGLGATALWLLPFYPSPLRDDGYDIADYTDVHPAYGTLDDFRRFLDEAHHRGLRVITELVVNHTSDQHRWFQRARSAPAGSPEREFYVWSDSPERYGGARVIFSDTELSNWSWDPVAQAYFWHRFYSHQPDLNFDNPAVFDAVRDVLDFWFEMGVDGMRLDAVPYLVEREGTHSENLRETHGILKRLRSHVDARFSNRMFLAEANQWPEDAAAYFGDGDESHMVFHFPLMPRLFMALRQEDRLPIVDILAQTPAAPDGCQWGLFLRNHDELTLEMVTEEERQYMYHVFATDPQARLNLGIRRRLAPLVGNDRSRIQLLNMLLFSMPGTPILYYGDEIGMGDNIYLGDRNGVRTPMQWSPQRNAGFSTANPQRLFLPLIVDEQYHYQTVNVEQQVTTGSSLLSWMTRMIAARRRYQAFGRGDIHFIDTMNTRVLAYTRRYGEEQVLVVANLSRFAQHVDLDLADWQAHVPIELFGRTTFPPIGSAPYTLTLTPHGCFWFELQAPRDEGDEPPRVLHELHVEQEWDEIVEGRARAELESALLRHVERRMALASGARPVLSVRIDDALRIRSGPHTYVLLVVFTSFTVGEPQRYLVALGSRRRTGRTERSPNDVALIRSARGRQDHVLYDASGDGELAGALFSFVRDTGSLQGQAGSLEAVRLADAHVLRRAGRAGQVRRVRRGPNTVVPLGGRTLLKLFRQLDAGINPEIELGAHLNAQEFPHVAAVYGSLHYHWSDTTRVERVAVGILQEFVENEGEAWLRAVKAAAAYVRKALDAPRVPPEPRTLLPSVGSPGVAADYDDLIGPYLDEVRLLAARTAALHRALAADREHPELAPEPLGPLSRRSSYQSMRTLAVAVTRKLRGWRGEAPPDMQLLVDELVARQDDVVAVFRRLLDRPMKGQRIRCHGNLHLGQVLHAAGDLMFIDFEGEPGRPLYERRLKRSPLQDVATLVRSYHYAGHAAGRRRDGTPPADAGRLAAWLRHWQRRVSCVFVEAYLAAIEDTGFLPEDPADAGALLDAHLLERAYYELGFELSHRPDWVRAPLADIPALLAPR
jgi:maltose alpha-D-glucosyltransferase / alpha-amylase